MVAKKISDKQFARIGRALAEPRRFRILEDISAAGGRTACSALQAKQHITAATMSHHIKELETAGLIDTTREGKFMTLAINRDVLSSYLDRLAKI
jgi:ArsR family transcriptional regulator